MRFSIVTLIVLVIPSLYIIIAAIAPGLPLHDVFAADNGGLNVIVTLACVALGYGIPYTFLSGYEIENPDAVAGNEVLEGGVEADLLETAETDESTEPAEDESWRNEVDSESAETEKAEEETEEA